MSTHDKEMWMARPTKFLAEINTAEVAKYDVIGIDEGQFFADIVPWVQMVGKFM